MKHGVTLLQRLKRLLLSILLLTAVLIGRWVIGREANAGAVEFKTAAVEQAAQSARQWTVIAVLPDERIFVNFPC